MICHTINEVKQMVFFLVRNLMNNNSCIFISLYNDYFCILITLVDTSNSSFERQPNDIEFEIQAYEGIYVLPPSVMFLLKHRKLNRAVHITFSL